MTGTRNPQQDGSIQAMLRDSGLDDAVELRNTLEQVRALVPDEAPVPRGDLAALLTAGVPAETGAPAETGTGTGTASVSDLADRRGRKRRMVLIGGAVVGAMSLGAVAVAASSQDFRENLGHTFTVIFKPGAPTPTPAPAPVGTAPTDMPAAQRPVPAGTSPAGTAPAPAVAAPGAAVPASPAPVATVPAPQRPAPVLTPPAVGREGVLPAPEKRPAVPVFPGKNGRGIPVSPLPTVPAVPEVPSTVPGS